MITYNIFSVRLILLTRGVYSDHNCLIDHNIFALDKTGYKISIQIQILLITVGYSNSTF